MKTVGILGSSKNSKKVLNIIKSSEKKCYYSENLCAQNDYMLNIFNKNGEWIDSINVSRLSPKRRDEFKIYTIDDLKFEIGQSVSLTNEKYKNIQFEISFILLIENHIIYHIKEKNGKRSFRVLENDIEEYKEKTEQNNDDLINTYAMIKKIMEENNLQEHASFIDVKNYIANLICDKALQK